MSEEDDEPSDNEGASLQASDKYNAQFKCIGGRNRDIITQKLKNGIGEARCTNKSTVTPDDATFVGDKAHQMQPRPRQRTRQRRPQPQTHPQPSPRTTTDSDDEAI